MASVFTTWPTETLLELDKEWEEVRDENHIFTGDTPFKPRVDGFAVNTNT